MPRPSPVIAPAPARVRRGAPRGAGQSPVSFAPAEVRALLRLGNELRDGPSDPAARKRRLLEGLCRILRADAGVCVVTHAAAPGGTSTVVTVARWGMTGDDADEFAAQFQSATGDGEFPQSGPVAWPLRTSQHCVESTVPVAGVRLRACVTLFRRKSRRRVFSARESSMLDLFHSESEWLYRLDLPLVSSAGLALTPRQRQTLQFLLAGHSEKQIAAHLGLSPNTVHHYVKAIHRHFRVSSRSELLAKWVRK